MPLKPEYREETYDKKLNPKIEFIVCIILVVLAFTFMFYRYDVNVYRIKISDMSVKQSILYGETISFTLNAKDLLNIDTGVDYYKANFNDLSSNEIEIEFTKDRYNRKDTPVKIDVEPHHDTIIFRTSMFRLRTKLIKNPETGQWEIHK